MKAATAHCHAIISSNQRWREPTLQVSFACTKRKRTMELVSCCKIISSICYFTYQGLPLRGQDNAESNLYQLFKLCAEDSQELVDWLKRKSSLHSVEIQYKIVQKLAGGVLRDFIREIKEHETIRLETTNLQQNRCVFKQSTRT